MAFVTLGVKVSEFRVIFSERSTAGRGNVSIFLLIAVARGNLDPQRPCD